MKELLLIVVSILLLTGCGIRGNFNAEIKDDKSFEFSFDMALDDELIEFLMSASEENIEEEINYTEEEKWEFVENYFSSSQEETPEDFGFTAKRYSEGNYKGFTYSKTVNNIDDITGDNASFDILENTYEIPDKNLFVKEGNNYISKIHYSPLSDLGEYEIDTEFKFSITLPNKAISHNATSVSEDGKTLTWQWDATQSGNIDFEFSFSSFPVMLVAIIGGAVLLIVIILVIIMVIRKSRKNRNSSNLDQSVENVENANSTTTQEINEPLQETPQSFMNIKPAEVTPTVEVDNQVQEPSQPFVAPTPVDATPTVEVDNQIQEPSQSFVAPTPAEVTPTVEVDNQVQEPSQPFVAPTSSNTDSTLTNQPQVQGTTDTERPISVEELLKSTENNKNI